MSRSLCFDPRWLMEKPRQGMRSLQEQPLTQAELIRDRVLSEQRIEKMRKSVHMHNKSTQYREKGA